MGWVGIRSLGKNLWMEAFKLKKTKSRVDRGLLTHDQRNWDKEPRVLRTPVMFYSKRGESPNISPITTKEEGPLEKSLRKPRLVNHISSKKKPTLVWKGKKCKISKEQKNGPRNDDVIAKAPQLSKLKGP